jgi:hypothetical protein
VVPAYANASGKSGVASYDDSLTDSIIVRFKRGSPRNYVYTVASCGRATVDKLKRFARAGWGLNRYITARVRNGYAQKW